MSLDLLAAARRLRVIAFLVALAWIFGITPPWPQRILLVVLTVAALAADTYLDEHLGHRSRHPRYDKAA